MSVQILCPFFKQVICFLGVEACELYILDANPLLDYVIYKYILPYYRMHFCSADGVLCYTEAFWFDVVPLVHFLLCFPYLRDVSRKKLFILMFKRFLPMLFL